MLLHHFNVFCVRYGITRRHLIALLLLLAIVGITMFNGGRYYDQAASYVEQHLKAAERARAAEQARAEMEDILNGKLAMVEPVGKDLAKVGTVKIEWTLVQVDN